MPKTVKPPWSPKPTACDPVLLEKMDSSWKELLETGKGGTYNPERIEILAEVLNKQTDLADIFLKKVLSEADLSVVRLLMALDDQVTAKKAHKLIKRALYLLQQKGLPVASETVHKGRSGAPGILKEIAPAQRFGYLSEFDEGGNRIAAMSIPEGIHGRVFIFVLINPEGEMESLSALEVNKKEAKRILADLEEQTGQTFLEADPEHTAFVIKEAHDRGSHLAKSDEAQWAVILNLLTGLKGIGHSPIIRTLLQPEQGAGEISLDMDRLSAIPDSARYLIKPELIEAYRESIKAVQEGILIVSQEQKTEQIQNIVRKAAEAIFQGESRIKLIRFLEETAYIYYLKGQRDKAGILSRAADSLDPAQEKRENPFLIRLMEKNLFLGRGQSYDEPGPKPEMETTQGGIIIPSWVNKEGLGR